VIHPPKESALRLPPVPHPKTSLLIISERSALAWVLKEERMAFPGGRIGSARELAVDDRLLLYTTRGCFHNPTRDRGRVIGVARVRTEVEELREPVRLADRHLTAGCSIEIEALARLHHGLELAPLVPRL
jgi:hypothetical protein